MPEGHFLFLDGKYLRADKLFIGASNRSFRYGDGCFETMRLQDGKIQLAQYHWERLFETLSTMHFELPGFFTPDYLLKSIRTLVAKNEHQRAARIRLSVFRGNGGLYDAENHFPHLLIQSFVLDNGFPALNENGWVVDVCPQVRKAADSFSRFKTNSFQPYTMAACWAKKNKLNDAIVLNAFDRIADTTMANIFIVHNGRIQTPALTEGAIGGVMRRHLIHQLQAANIPVDETTVTQEDLFSAHEVILTNAIRGVRWVKQIGRQHYTAQMATQLHHLCSQNLFAG